ncbi:MAG TPA: MscL family protein [Acidimicrobiales bacterium]|jgi:large conductance mechanosensitive channel
MKGFKAFLLQGNLIVIAVGLVVALAVSTLISAFTTNVITPLIDSLAGTSSANKGLGWHVHGQFINLGAFIGALIYFVIFMAVVYFILVVPYRTYMKRIGETVFSAPAPAPPTKTCPECLSADLPVAATKCLHCASVLTQ